MNNNFETHYGRQGILSEIYESDDLLNEGILSFEYPLYHATDEELDYFLGSIAKRVSRAASRAAKTVGRTAKAVGRGIRTVSKIVPVSVLTSGLAHLPLGFAIRAGIGALSAAASGKNVFQGAARSLASSPAMRFAVDTAGGVARGQNVFKAAKSGAQGAIGDIRESLRFAAIVAPFVPGLGTGVAAALGAANALAAGERITDALIAGARNALPGGALAKTGFDLATRIAKGENFSQAALNTMRSQLPGGPIARAAFDSGVSLMKGRSIQDSIIAGGGRLLPKSPFSADVMSFVKKATSGENLGRAALSSVGNLVMKRVEQQTGPIISTTARRLPIDSRRFPQRFRRLPRFQREVSEPLSASARNDEGTWTRRGDSIIVFGS